jgi:hypothetical protein
MLNVSTFADTADIYAIMHFVSHPCQHITVDQSQSSGDTVAKIPEINNYTRGLLVKLGEIHSLSAKNYHDPMHNLFVVNF